MRKQKKRMKDDLIVEVVFFYGENTVNQEPPRG